MIIDFAETQLYFSAGFGLQYGSGQAAGPAGIVGPMTITITSRAPGVIIGSRAPGIVIDSRRPFITITGRR